MNDITQINEELPKEIETDTITESSVIRKQGYLAIEDYLQNEECFGSGLDGRTTHMDSYMTVMDFDKTIKSLIEFQPNYSKEEWTFYANYWHANQYLSPMSGLLCIQVHRYILKDYDKWSDEMMLKYHGKIFP